MSEGVAMSNRETIKTTVSKPSISIAGVLQRKCGGCGQHTLAGGGCSDCEKKKGLLQRRASGGEATGEAPLAVHEVLRTPGQPLDRATRAYMEPRFGHDFSRVRVHTDERAAESARAVNSLAYTVGPDIVFGAQQYAPSSTSGRRLLAHELAHTIQQSGAAGSLMTSLRVGAADDTHEREAEARAAQVVEGRTTAPAPKPSFSAAPCLQRQPQPKGKADEAEKTTCMQTAGKRVFSRGNDDPAECQYETARTTVSLMYDPCVCSPMGATSMPLRLEYLAIMGGKSYSDEAGTLPETQASTIAARMNLEEEPTGRGGPASGGLIHTADTGKGAIPGDPGDTLSQSIDLSSTIPCKGGTASGSLSLGLYMTSGGVRSRYTAEKIDWSLTTLGKKVTKFSISIDETTPSGRVATKTVDVTGGKGAYPKFPGTPRDTGCSCQKVTGVQVGKSCKPKGGAGFGGGGN
jgi:hypothetical protein